jgi:hypothetical protein
MRHKNEVLENVKRFKVEAENQTKKSLKIIISDGGGEFNNQLFTDFCSEFGIVHHFSPPYTPQNNGMAERANKSIVEKARCMLTQAKLSAKSWAEAINTATEICNALPSRSRNFLIPYETWYNRKFNYQKLKPFGFLAYYLKEKKFRYSKLAPTAEKGVFLGYLNDFSTYKIINLKGSIVSTRELSFKEDYFPGSDKEILKNDVDPFLWREKANDVHEEIDQIRIENQNKNKNKNKIK